MLVKDGGFWVLYINGMEGVENESLRGDGVVVV